MTTVALRGTLIPIPAAAATTVLPGQGKGGVSSKDVFEASGKQSVKELEELDKSKRLSLVPEGWEWKGMWSFGSNVASAPLQSQQPFLYTFQSAMHPSEVAVPGVPTDAEDELAEESKETQEQKNSELNSNTQNQASSTKSETPNSDPATWKSTEMTKPETDSNGEDSVVQMGQKSSTEKTIESSMAERSKKKSKVIATEKAGMESKTDPQSSKPSGQDVPDQARVASLTSTDDKATEEGTLPTTAPSASQAKTTLTSIPETKESDTGSQTQSSENQTPTSGLSPQNSSSNQNIAKPLASDERKKITFANVPPEHPPFTEAATNYPDRPCPASGQWKGHFQNVSGRPRDKPQKVQETFFLFFNATPGPDVKYTFDDTELPPTVHLETLVLVKGMGTNPFGTFEIVGYLDLTSMVLEIQRQYVYIPRSPRNHRRNNSSSPSSRRGSSSLGQAMTTRNKKSYFTRKRQPSWKRKSQEEQKEEFQNHSIKKRQRVAQGGGAKKTKVASTGTSAVGSTMISTPECSGIRSCANGASDPLLPAAASSASNNTNPLDASSLAAMPTTALGHTYPSLIAGASHVSNTGISDAQQSTTTRKQSKSSRKRNSSSSANKSNIASGGSSSQCIKLPPIGDPKKARWRAAHFLYYQRHDPDQSIDSNDGNNNNSSSSATPNPRYVVYEGEMANGLREGRGICLFSNGMLYEGEWKRNKEHGRGKLWTSDRQRLIYDGEWERGRMQGQGTYYYNANDPASSTSKIGGSVKAGATGSNPHRRGMARQTGPLGDSRYIGEFKENMRNGMGQYILPDGSVYNGMWSQGKMNGRGVFTWPDHSVYDGEWKDGQRHGQGLLKTSDGFVYDGMWVHNAMEGRGMARYPNGQTYEGLFSNGRREGRGTMQFTNGAVYEGRFRDDAVDGQGTMKMSRALVVPNDEDHENELANEGASIASTKTKSDFMIPISFQSDMTHIHAKAGFTAVGD